jgi:CRISPR-associated endonuclease Csn1
LWNQINEKIINIKTVMKKVLGLDLGTASIGWAFIFESENNGQSKILGMGSRIIPLTTAENDEFTKGNAQSTNAGRRIKRGMRRNLQRYKLRKQDLIEMLQKYGLMPDATLFTLDALALYGLRNNAVDSQITLQEFGRLLFMLNQKRGYKSNRKANNEEENRTLSNSGEEDELIENDDVSKKTKKRGYLDLIADREAIIAKENITVGQYFYQQLVKASQSNLPFRVKENIFMRKSYINEFEKIWDCQQKFYPTILTNELRELIRDTVIYYQRSLKSQKALVSECRFEKYHKVAPKSSPLFQVFKIWQEINNLEIISYKGIKGEETDSRFDQRGKRELDLQEKQLLFTELSKCEKMTKREMLKLFYKIGVDNYSVNLEKDIEGNRTMASFIKLFTKLGIERPNLLQYNYNGSEIVDQTTGKVIMGVLPDSEHEPLYQIWHLLYSVEDPETVVKRLIEKFQFSEDQAKALSKLNFHKSGYGNLSTRAIRKILPFLQLGLKYSEACFRAGYNHSASKTKEENLQRKLVDKLQLLEKGALRNPVVEKILNHTINLVNDIFEHPEYGKPDEIRVELARELRRSADERKKDFKRNNETKAYHDKIEKELHSHGFTRVSRNDIERYKLWQEFGEISPYEPQKSIGLAELFNGSYDIEHIIPKSRIFDDSFQNKTICPRSMNSGSTGAKNQMTAFDYMKSRGQDEFNAYVEFVTKAYRERNISKAKFNRLMMSSESEEFKNFTEDFISRQLNETRYIASEIKKLLTRVCHNVNSTSGAITDYQRHIWGYDLITQRLNWEKFDSAGKTRIEKDKNENTLYLIDGWSKRDDHRHHAIDALVIASTKQSTIQRLNRLNQIVEAKNGQSKQDALKETDLLGVEEYVKKVCPFTEQDVLDSVSKILVSFKAGKRVAIINKNSYKHSKKTKATQISLTPRGQLSEATVYGKIQLKDYKIVTLDSKFEKVDYIADAAVKALVKKRLFENENDPSKAFKKLKENPILNDKQESIISVKVWFYRDEFVVRYYLGFGQGLLFTGKEDKAKAEKILSAVIDLGARNAIRERLVVYNYDIKKALKDLNNDPVYLNKEKGIVIKAVRCATGLNNPRPMHITKDGKTYPASAKFKNTSLVDAKPVDFVKTGNNHHIAIYRNADGKLFENAVSFWDALNRKRLNIPVIIKNPKGVWDYVLGKDFPEDMLENLPKDDWQFETSMQQNEMFIFGMDVDTIKFSIEHGELDLISKNLFKVQSISESDYSFVHHLETKKDNSKASIEMGRYKRIQSMDYWAKCRPVKIVLSRLGQIVRIGG